MGDAGTRTLCVDVDIGFINSMRKWFAPLCPLQRLPSSTHCLQVPPCRRSWFCDALTSKKQAANCQADCLVSWYGSSSSFSTKIRSMFTHSPHLLWPARMVVFLLHGLLLSETERNPKGHMFDTWKRIFLLWSKWSWGAEQKRGTSRNEWGSDGKKKCTSNLLRGKFTLQKKPVVPVEVG